MVDTPKNDSGDDKENPAKEDPPKTQPMRRRQWRRSKSCRSRIATPAQETTTLRMVPKTQKNPMNKLPNETIGNQGMPALTNKP